MKFTVGSVCSGIEASSVAWEDLCDFQWFSEIAKFPSDFLKYKYPDIPNLGDMSNIPLLLKDNTTYSVDMICAGTPCQAFSLAGKKQGLKDDRGNLTLNLINIIEENDKILYNSGKRGTILFWENVEGVLKDKTNAFVQFITLLSGSDELLPIKCFSAGVVYGLKRNIAWRILDAKHFGVPQQRRRLYLLAGDKDFYPENILFEYTDKIQIEPINRQNNKYFEIEGQKFEIFREYTDCLYSAYGTKWNGNAAAYNGSLFIFQNERLRRFNPLECERLMGFPDNYTDVDFASSTARYQAVGNSWAVPVIKWIGQRLFSHHIEKFSILNDNSFLLQRKHILKNGIVYYDFSDYTELYNGFINTSSVPNITTSYNIKNIIDINCPENYYISPVGCYGIIRRAKERGCKINDRLEYALSYVANQWDIEIIEKVSKIQPRGNFVKNKEELGWARFIEDIF
ncbi:MAG: DNA cytosine methyltransferase [Deferribacteraceae bacterium]|jgi:DNA (cytosine-5)-methyltransferase 1|nr:DNA cytosine methyltransferase [Deferribacteraceae bacterium]